MTESTEEQFERFVARQRARIDQGSMALREVSPVLWTFHQSLVEQGFTRDEALSIVIAYFTGALPKT